jgi:hypothetical protein
MENESEECCRLKGGAVTSIRAENVSKELRSQRSSFPVNDEGSHTGICSARRVYIPGVSVPLMCLFRVTSIVATSKRSVLHAGII